jgi:sugar lactone lactonase YvrE
MAEHRRLLKSGLVMATLGAFAVPVALPGPVPGGRAASVFGNAKSTRPSQVTVIAAGLNNPRGLALDGDGNLWVAEAGTGGPECLSTPGQPHNPTCFGTTGSLSEIKNGKLDRVFTGLASDAAPDGTEADGPNGLAIRDHYIYTVIARSNFSIPQGLSPSLTVDLMAQTGRLLRGAREDRGDDGSLLTLADPGDYDFAWSDLPANKPTNRQFPDSNPYGLLVTKHNTFVVDAGTNTLDSIDHAGHVTVLAEFPSPPLSDAVPTCVAEGADGALYIGELTGNGNGAGAADVFRYTTQQGLQVWQTGFSAITGCGFGSDGSFYVVEFDTTGFPPHGAPAGDVVRVAINGTRTVLGAGQLFAPNGFAADNHGTIYVDNWSIMPGSSTGGPTGEVVRLG